VWDSGNMKQPQQFYFLVKSTGWKWNQRYASIRGINIFLFWPLWSLEQDWRLSKVYLPVSGLWRSRFFRFSWDRQKLFVDPTPMETFLSQVVTWPAATPQGQGRQRRESLGSRLRSRYVCNRGSGVQARYSKWGEERRESPIFWRFSGDVAEEVECAVDCSCVHHL